MVSTRKAGKTRKIVEETFSPAGSGDEYEEGTPGPSKTCGTKRARTSKTTRGGKSQGKRRKTTNLSMLPDMPIDVLYEIFSLVHPRDLIQLSWTSKILNGFLTSRSSRHVWQASFKTIPENETPPPCPSEITEIAYAGLLYFQFCMNCGSSSPPILAWSALTRLCGFCVDKLAMTLYETWNRDFMLYEAEMVKILPTFAVYKRGTVSMALRSDYEQFKEELAAAGEGNKENVIEKWESFVRKRDEFHDALVILERLAEQAKVDTRTNIQERRIEKIWEKLSEDGWREEIAARKSEYEPGLLKIKGVVMIRPLGEKAWADLRGPLNKFMKEESGRIRAELLRERLESRTGKIEEIVSSFGSSLPHPHDFSPSAADICWIPEVRKTIISGTDEEFRDREAEVRSRISELSATWLEERIKVLLRLLPQDSPSTEHLSLATTLFDCKGCNEFGMRIEAALSHKCCCDDDSRFSKFPNVASRRFFCYEVGVPWNLRTAMFKYSGELSALVRAIVVECGEDPDTITTKEMNKKNHRFARFNADGSISVLNWFQAFEHKNWSRNPSPCRFLRPDELPEYVPNFRTGRWGCVRCWRTGESVGGSVRSSPSSIKEHLAKSHQIANPTEEDYYHDDPNFTPSFRYGPVGGA